ncbi:MAG: hypothetical protein KDD48_04350 [Bdellovibrionales bacterium]|nr:hypothetical protein [Bdellovibrionales bacterium]
MKSHALGGIILVVAFGLVPELLFAYGGFEGRMNNLSNQLITVVLPLVSILGLVYAALLAVAGDGAARTKIIAVIVASVIGFLAPQIIGFLQNASGS